MKSIIHFFTEEDGRCRQIVNGVVESLNKRKIIQCPIGTNDIVILWERVIPRYAQVRNFSLPLGFPLDGAKILKNDYYKFNIDRKLFFVIKRLVCEIDANFYKIYYKHLYRGELDFSTFDDDKSNARVNMNIMEGGISKLVKANEDTEIAIPFDSDAIDVLMDGILLDGTYNWIIPTDQSLGTFYLGMYQLPSEKSAPGIAVFDVTQEPVDFADTANAGSFQYWTTSIQDISNVQISGVIKYVQEGPSGGPLPDPTIHFTLQLQIFNSETNAPRLDIYLINPSDTYQSTQDIPFSTTVNLLKGDRLFLKKIGRFRESSIGMNVKSRPASRIVKHFKPFDLWKKICIKLGISESKIFGDILKSSTYCVTCGDAVRGLANSVIKTTFNNFCKAFNVYHFTGVQIKETIELESRYKYFVPDSVDSATNLPIVRDFHVTPALDQMFSSIKIGHQEQNIQDLNGKFDYNGYQIYITPITRVSTQMDLQSPYKSGPFEETILQTNLDGKTTTDDDSDNDIFVNDINIGQSSNIKTVVSVVLVGNYFVFENSINVQVGSVFTIVGTANNDGTYTVTNVVSILVAQIIGVQELLNSDEVNINVFISFVSGFLYKLDRSVIPDSGVPDPDTVFNVRLRPAALFKVHERWIRSYCYNYDALQVTFSTGNMNNDLVVAGVSDSANRNIVDMGNRIFIPDYLDFTTPVPIDLNDILETDPNKPFAPTFEETRYTGFLWKAGLAPNSRKEQAFTLLSSIENNREDLI